MAVKACDVHGICPGDKVWAILLPGRNPVCVTVVAVQVDRDSAGQALWATLDVQTVFGHVVTIMHSDLVRRAS